MLQTLHGLRNQVYQCVLTKVIGRKFLTGEAGHGIVEGDIDEEEVGWMLPV